MPTVQLLFSTLSELTTFSEMVNEQSAVNSDDLTITGTFADPFIVIAQRVFEATLL